LAAGGGSDGRRDLVKERAKLHQLVVMNPEQLNADPDSGAALPVPITNFRFLHERDVFAADLRGGAVEYFNNFTIKLNNMVT
jgi:hypothetical protein